MADDDSFGRDSSMGGGRGGTAGASSNGSTLVNRAQILLLFAVANLLPALADLLHNVLTDMDGDAAPLLDAADKIGDLLMAVATTASARSYLASRDVLKVLVRDLRYLHPALLLKTLKVLRQVSALSAMALDGLQKANAIPTLVGLLDRTDGPFVVEIRNLVIYILFNLCRVYKPRQELAALAGLVPHLRSFCAGKSSLKELAIQILCDMADAGEKTRAVLSRHQILEFYLDLLSTPSYVQALAMQAIANWVVDEVQRGQTHAEDLLLQSAQTVKIVQAFQTAKFQPGAALGNPVDALDRLLRSSLRLSAALADTPLAAALATRLNSPDVVLRKTLLRILTALYASHKQPATFLAANASLVAAIERTAASDPAILVQEMARNLRDAFKAAAAPTARPPPAAVGTPAARPPPVAAAPSRPPPTAGKPAPTTSTKGA